MHIPPPPPPLPRPVLHLPLQLQRCPKNLCPIWNQRLLVQFKQNLTFVCLVESENSFRATGIADGSDIWDYKIIIILIFMVT